MPRSVRILALESTDLAGSVATWHEGRLVCELALAAGQRSAQSLAPGIVAVLAQSGWRPAEVGLMAVTVGPGSFTGLRVGVTTAKAFAYACGASVVGLDTLEVLAAAVPCTAASRLAAAVDAQRGDVVAGTFVPDGADGWIAEAPARLIDWQTWLDGLPDGAAVASPLLRKRAADVPARLVLTPQSHWTPRAGVVARLAEMRLNEGRLDDVWQLAPRYSRPSAAEEKARRTKDAQPR